MTLRLFIAFICWCLSSLILRTNVNWWTNTNQNVCSFYSNRVPIGWMWGSDLNPRLFEYTTQVVFPGFSSKPFSAQRESLFTPRGTSRSHIDMLQDLKDNWTSFTLMRQKMVADNAFRSEFFLTINNAQLRIWGQSLSCMRTMDSADKTQTCNVR